MESFKCSVFSFKWEEGMEISDWLWVMGYQEEGKRKCRVPSEK
jgi:hypothetical protein